MCDIYYSLAYKHIIAQYKTLCFSDNASYIIHSTSTFSVHINYVKDQEYNVDFTASHLGKPPRYMAS